ncbi:ankyrin repeat domain-containing protein 26-like isoform X1 [Perognathus longimembris pacificus]|uniref:ankyrin repeat domain-containing protein 26-like isoform X1 n=1 Tax=Perognathus longimembris pacificus TaxID=214514 RepID=UPI002018D5C4|nr:ankyrin repeat domain-containing protein 26-like isoform X1 [Perognathus longimembris pacificus]
MTFKISTFNCRFALKQEEEERRNIDGLYEKIKEQLRDKEEQYNNVVKMRQTLGVSVRTLSEELKTVKNDLSQALQERNDTLRKLSEEQSARILQDEILENHLSKQKEMEISKAKMSSENSGLVEKMEVESSKYGHLHQENELLRHELLSMTNVQKKCGTLEKDKKKLEEEIVKLKSHMAKNMLELSQMEQYKQMIEDGTKQELEEKLTEVNLFLQVNL